MNRIEWLLATGGNPCFGVTEALFGIGLSGILGGAAGGLGLGAEAAGVAGTIGADVAGGAAAGTALSGIEGQPLGPGALTGAITGGAGGVAGAFGPAIADATGLPAAGVEAGIGAAGGVLGATAGGGSPLQGAITGGIGGVAAGLNTPTPTPAAAPTGSLTPPGSGASAAGIAGDPAGALLDQTGGTNFLGTMGGGTIAAPAAGGGAGTGGGGPTDFLLPGTDQPVAGGFLAPAPVDTSTSSGTGGGVSDFVSKHWPMLASAGILGYEALTKNQPLPQETALQANATGAAGQAAALSAPINTGVLPPGAKQAVDAATQAQKGQIKSTYANLGLTGSTMEAQATGAVDRQAAAQTFSIADKLLSQGIDYSKLNAQDLQFLIDEQLKQDTAFTGALGSFAGGLAGAKVGG